MISGLGWIICEIRPTVKGSADHEVDASGKTVTPGFVDAYTHYDGQATWDNHLIPLLLWAPQQ